MKAMLKQKAPIAVLVLWCVALLAFREWYSGSRLFDFLYWNLGLAVIPFFAASLLRVLPDRTRFLLPKALFFATWFIFLPNAPYLVTDLMHLRISHGMPIWFDVVLFGSYAATGMLVCYASVADVEAALAPRLGLAAKAAGIGALLLCGFGIYLGRVERWNSWDLLTSPKALARQSLHPLAHPVAHHGAWEISIVYGVGLVLGYLALKAVSSSIGASERGVAFWGPMSVPSATLSERTRLGRRRH
jgi:uncharacterized membrane protein